MRTNPALLMIVATLFAWPSNRGASATDANWPQFLGPGSRAVSSNANLPDRWSATENVAWKTPIPGRGWSSPIAWGERVFLTTVEGGDSAEMPQKGLYLHGERPVPSPAEHQWKVLCLDLLTGKLLWERVVHHGPPPGPTHSKNSYASETPVTDGERVYACFGNVGLFCLDFEGRTVWSKSATPHAMMFNWGTASSPVLQGDRLYLVNDNDDKSYLLALDKRTGKELWRTDRSEKSNWSTPYVWENRYRTEIVTPGSWRITAYDLDGKRLWWCRGMAGITIATPYADGNLLYVSSDFIVKNERPVYAIRAGATGDISLKPGQTSNGAIAWSNPTAGPYVPTTLVYDGRLYVVYDRGLLSVFDSRTGKPLYEKKRPPDAKHFTASPWAHNGKVFCLNEDGVTFVVRGGDKYELLRTNKLADDDMCLASPAMVGDRLLIRTSARMYCIIKGSP